MLIRSILGTAGLLAATAAAVITASTATAQPPEAEKAAVLVFSKTAAFRHSSIPQGIATIAALGERHGFAVDATESAGAFNDANLAKYDAVVWLSTTGDVLNDTQQAAFERYIQGGGGYVGVHAASDTEYTWPWYGGLVGAYFNGHPAQQTATIDVADSKNYATRHLPSRWTRFDEWYNFRDYTEGSVNVLAELDESTYNPGSGAMGDHHPIVWCHEYDGGKAFYTGMGHTEASYDEPEFRAHLLGGIQQVSGLAKFNCGTD